MMHEVRSIPPAPRRVRMRPLVAHRWPLLALGAVLTVVGGLVAWLMFLQSGGKMSDGARLDAGGGERTFGRVSAVLDDRHFDGRRWQDLRFEFHWNGTMLWGGSFVPDGDYRKGDEVEVEVLPTNPDVSRVVGGMLHRDREWLRARFWILSTVLPGMLLLSAWLAGFLRLRAVLVHGDASVALVTAVRRVPFLLPEMLEVEYEFRDHRALPHHNHHWVRVHGSLGARLTAQAERGVFEPMPVLHHRERPHWNRLLLPADFLPAATTPAMAGTA